jgi:putative hydrolase of the HAD superfamily
VVVKAVLFDLGDTLIESSRSAYEAFSRIIACEGIDVSLEEVKKAFILAREELGDELNKVRGKIPSSEVHNVLNLQVLTILGIQDGGTLVDILDQQWPRTGGTQVYPDVHPALAMLKRNGIKTGIVSNVYEAQIHKKCHLAGLDQQGFDIYVGADTVQKAKPDPAIFVYALEQLRIRAEEAVYVGDDLEHDYRAAERVGMHPLLLVRGTGDIPDGVRHIRRLTALQDFVDESSEEGVSGNTGHRAVNRCHLHKR